MRSALPVYVLYLCRSSCLPLQHIHSLLTHAPATGPHVPAGKHVDEGVGLPVKPVEHLAVHTVPTLTLDGQLKAPLGGTVEGLPVHTAGTAMQAGRQGEMCGRASGRAGRQAGRACVSYGEHPEALGKAWYAMSCRTYEQE